MSRKNHALVYCYRAQPFRNVEELNEMFLSLDSSKLSYVPPVMPKGGEVYMFTWNLGEEDKKNDWRCDQHKWRNNGSRKYPSGDPKYTKYFHTIITETGKTSADFQRNAFMPLDPAQRLTLVHYFGDESLSTTPHVNKPKNNKNKIKRKAANSLSVPAQIRPKVKKESPNVDRCRNVPHFRDYSRNQLMGLLDLRELAFQLGGFVQTVMVVPQALCMCGSEEIVSEFSKVLDLQWSDAQLLWLNTSVKIGDYYVSPLFFRHLLFDKSPTLPVVFAIHHQPLEDCICEILLHFASRISQFVTTTVPFIVQRKVKEKVKSVLPNAKLFYAWSDIRDEARSWMLAHGVKDTSTCMTQLTELLEARTPEQFDTLLTRHKTFWDADWLEYFTTELETDIRESASRWVLQEENIFSSYTGVLTQECQGYDTVTDSLPELLSVTPDMMVLSLYHLHNYLTKQVRLAQCGQPAIYSLRRQFREAIMDPTEVVLPDHVIAPEFIVPTIQDQFKSVSNSFNTSDDASRNSFADSENIGDNETLIETGPSICEVHVAQSPYHIELDNTCDIDGDEEDGNTTYTSGSLAVVKIETE